MNGKTGIEQNIAKNLLKPLGKTNGSEGNVEDFAVNGVNLFPSNQRADARPLDEEDCRDEYWRKNFINYDAWRKEDQAIHKNRKLPRPPSKSKLNQLAKT